MHCARGRRLPTIVRGYEPLDGEVPAKPIPRRWPLWLQLSALLCSGFSGLRWRLRSRRSTSYRTRGCGFIVAGTHTALFQPPTPVHNAIASRLLGFNCFHIQPRELRWAEARPPMHQRSCYSLKHMGPARLKPECREAFTSRSRFLRRFCC